ncbi:MAG: alpha/beta fold hydrolase, partial [Pseudomonadota bacterium]
MCGVEALMCVRGRFAAVIITAVLTLHLAALTPRPATAGVYVPVSTPSSGTVNLYAEEHGRGRPILMVHGLAASTYTWRNVVPTLARRNRVITLDMKGFGRSDKPFDRAYSSHDHADLIVAFIRKTRLRDVTLIGHSYGGAVSLLVAEKLRRDGDRRIRNMIIMNAPAFPQKPTPFVSFMGTPVLPYAV